MAEIVINDIEPLNGYTASGGETGFDFDFPIFDADDLVVLEIEDDGTVNTLVRGDDYSVTGTGLADGGSIVFDLTPYPDGAEEDFRYVLYRDLAVSRVTDFLTGGDFKAETMNRELDKLVMMLQQNELEIKRSLGLQKADAEDEINFEIETAAARTDKVLIFGASGNTVKAGPTSGDITTVANSIANVNIVGAAIANVNTVAGAIANVNTVAGIAANVTTVAGISANVTTVAGISANVTTVAGIDTEVAALGPIAADITAVAAIDSDVTTVAANDANITTLAGLDTEITALGAITADITAAAAIDTEISAVAAIASDVTTVAANIAGVNSFAERYRVEASDPATSLDEGDLVYNTTDNVLKYYDGASWNSIAPGISQVVDDTTPQLGGMLDVNGQAIGDGTRELLTFTEDGSAVNHLNIENQATGGGPILSAVGDDTNINLLLRAKGTGVLDLDGLLWPSADGTADQVLKTDGAGNISFGSVSGGLVLLGTATASGASSIDFISLIDGTYECYLLEFSDVYPSSDGAVLNFRLSSNNGSSYATSYNISGVLSTPTGAGAVSNSALGGTTADGKMIDGNTNDGTDTAGGAAGHIFIHDPYVASTKKTKFTGQVGSLNNNIPTGFCSYSFSGMRNTAAADNACQLKYDTGNINGKAKLYGVIKS
jgi:hypothetical protein